MYICIYIYIRLYILYYMHTYEVDVTCIRKCKWEEVQDPLAVILTAPSPLSYPARALSLQICSRILISLSYPDFLFPPLSLLSLYAKFPLSRCIYVRV